MRDPLPFGAIRQSAVPGREFSATIAGFVGMGRPVTASGIAIGAGLATGGGPDVGATAAAGPASPNAGAATGAVVDGTETESRWSGVQADTTTRSAAVSANRRPSAGRRALLACRDP